MIHDKDEMKGSWLVLDSIPQCLEHHYGVIPSKIFIRKCYEDLYQEVTVEILKPILKRSVFLFQGIPGIGKSIFMIYFILKYSIDNRFLDKRFALEFNRGVYHYFIPTEVNGEYYMSMVRTERFPIAEVIVFCDMEQLEEPYEFAKSLFIFSSPNPKRYKNKMKTSHRYTYTLPIWTEDELCIVNPNINIWYDRYEKWGGVPRSVLWDGTGNKVEQTIDTMIRLYGHRVIKNFFQYGFSEIDSLTDYTLIHMNPQKSQDGKYIYQSPNPIVNFATDYIFRILKSVFKRYMLREPARWFHTGCDAAVAKYGYDVASSIFEKICLWIVPLENRTISCESLSNPTTLSLNPITLPTVALLTHQWKKEGCLASNILYQPKVTNLEFGHAFCVLQIYNSLAFIILQITIAEYYPVKLNGLKCILNAFSEEVRLSIERKIIIFVTPLDGKLRTIQSYHMGKDIVFKDNNTCHEEEDNFEQWVLRYNPLITETEVTNEI